MSLSKSVSFSLPRCVYFQQALPLHTTVIKQQEPLSHTHTLRHLTAHLRLRTAYYNYRILTTTVPGPTLENFTEILKAISNGSISAYSDDYIPTALLFSQTGASCSYT